MFTRNAPRLPPLAAHVGMTVGSDHVTLVFPSHKLRRLFRWAGFPIARRGRPGDQSVRIALASERPFGAALIEAVSELREQTGIRHAIVHVAILPELCASRLIRLPPLDDAAAASVVARDAALHFAGWHDGDAGVAAVGRTRRGNAPVLASICSEAVISAVHDACRSAGWHAHSIVPALPAWVRAATSRRGARRFAVTSMPRNILRPARRARRATGLVVVTDHTTLALHLDGDQPSSLRHVPATSRPVDYGTPGSPMYLPVTALLENGEPRERPGRVSLLAPPEAGGVIAQKAQNDGWFVDRIDGHPDEIAARFAHAVRTHQLLSQQGWADRTRRQRRSALRHAAAAAVVICAAAAVELWGTTRKIEAVSAQRTALAAAVQPILAARDSLTSIHERLTRIEHIADEGPRWAPLLVDLSLRLPEDAYVTGVRAQGDSVLIDGWAKRTGAALEGLRTSPNLDAIRVNGPIRRETSHAGEPLERFTLVGRLSLPGAQASAHGAARTTSHGDGRSR